MENSSVQQVDNSLNITSSTGRSFWIDRSFNILVHGFALITVNILLWMIAVVYREAKPAIDKFGLDFIWSQDWDTLEGLYGALPYIYGTLVSSGLAILIAIPVGLAVALVTSEDFLPDWVKSPIAFIVELIAAIPSVIIGLWAIYVLIPFLVPIQEWLYNNLSWIPLFDTEDTSGNNMMTAAIVLAIMILPTMAAISRDVLLVIPRQLRTGAMALGSTRWETIFRVLLPAGFSGIVGATMLALGRALGETMAVTMVIGNFNQIKPSLLEAAYTIPAVLANEFAEAENRLHVGALTYLALILFALTLVVNIGAVILVHVIDKNKK